MNSIISEGVQVSVDTFYQPDYSNPLQSEFMFAYRITLENHNSFTIIHHLRPGMHYTEMPNEFLKRKDEFARNKAIVFDGIHYLHVFVYLLTKRYDKLADNLVNINNMFSSREEAIKLMKERTAIIR